MDHRASGSQTRFHGGSEDWRSLVVGRRSWDDGGLGVEGQGWQLDHRDRREAMPPRVTNGKD